ncbi:hypothetical protein [Vibrio sonorensis]|uniref:hypothetical protein n=1 Tax=Vibrio sonorensis TaxID=1004316 RepID=UPI0008D9B65D|nr:hypothetical protein [Vibrio sonorensis]
MSDSEFKTLINALAFLFLIFVARPIAKKAGFPGWWIIFLAIPVLNLILIWMFAFIKWPVEEEK